VAGFIEEGRRQKWTMLPTVYSHSMPRGAVSKAAFESWPSASSKASRR
jgi:hypothetical protein